MPNIFVKIPKGVASSNQLDAMVAGITDAACEAESIPDNPRQRAMTWVMVEEVEAANVYLGGNKVVPAMIPVVVQIFPPEGVLDAKRREGQAKKVAEAVHTALGEEAEKVLVSCMMLDVPDGTWGVNGAIWTLPDFAKAAGYEHLQDAN